MDHFIPLRQTRRIEFVRIFWWNVENMYDYHDDSLTMDDDFTPGGLMHWTYAKFRMKLNHIAKVILASGEQKISGGNDNTMSGSGFEMKNIDGRWKPPGIIGLCEVENRYVLNKLVFDSPLASVKYRIIHRDSPDPRGIDVAFLYREQVFKPVYTEWIPVRFPFDSINRTRDILYVKGILAGVDTVHFFLNHWPSRRGGEVESAPKRKVVAEILRAKVDSIFQHGQFANGGWQLANDSVPYIFIMGDFNDEPEDASIVRILGARPVVDTSHMDGLINLMYPKWGMAGSHKYQGHWSFLDQVIVSGSFLRRSGNFTIDPQSVVIFSPDFLVEPDGRYLGMKPRRTLAGPRYLGGFSDHLPVITDIKVREPWIQRQEDQGSKVP